MDRESWFFRVRPAELDMASPGSSLDMKKKKKAAAAAAAAGGGGGGGADDETGAEDIVPLPIQTFLWRQTRYYQLDSFHFIESYNQSDRSFPVRRWHTKKSERDRVHRVCHRFQKKTTKITNFRLFSFSLSLFFLVYCFSFLNLLLPPAPTTLHTKSHEQFVPSSQSREAARSQLHCKYFFVLFFFYFLPANQPTTHPQTRPLLKCMEEDCTFGVLLLLLLLYRRVTRGGRGDWCRRCLSLSASIQSVRQRTYESSEWVSDCLCLSQWEQRGKGERVGGKGFQGVMAKRCHLALWQSISWRFVARRRRRRV